MTDETDWPVELDGVCDGVDGFEDAESDDTATDVVVCNKLRV